MRLVGKVLGFLLSKAFLAGAMTVALFVGGLAIAQLREAANVQDQLEKVDGDQRKVNEQLDGLQTRYEKSRAEAQNEFIEFRTGTVKVQIARSKRRIAEQERRVDSLVKGSARACSFLGGKPVDAFLFGQPCADARKKVREARAMLRDFQQGRENAERKLAILKNPDLTNRQKLERLGEDPDRPGDPEILAQIEDKKSERDQLRQEEDDLINAQGSWAGQLVTKWGESRDGVLERWSQVWLGLLGVVLLILLTPAILRTVGYFALMPLVSRAQKPLQLAAEPEHAAATLHASPAERTLPIRLSAGDVLLAREGHVVPVQGQTRSQIFYDRRAPFTSYAAGLHDLARITGDEDGAETTLAASNDPNSYLMRIDFTDHPGVVMRPTHVVGTIGALELKKRWRFGIQALATWQVRYIMFAGTGSLIVQGSGNVAAEISGDRPTRINQNRMMGFDSRLTARVGRTEVFLPYLKGTTPLIVDEFTGPYLFFWQKSDTAGPSNPAVKAFNAVRSTIGKLLGF